MIVAVTGGKGGVGKSTVSLNLARELDAVVVDADLSTADLPRGHGPDLHDVLAGRATPLEAVDSFGPVRVLPCGRTLAGARAANLSALEGALRRLERACGRVVVDCPAGLARDVGTQLESAHATVLVTTPTECALVDALRTRALARDLETPVASVVLNRVKKTDSELVTRVERWFRAETTLIEERELIDEAMAQWRPVRDWSPACEEITAFDSLARSIERSEKRLSGRVGVL